MAFPGGSVGSRLVTAVVQVPVLAWELLYAAGAVKKKIFFNLFLLFLMSLCIIYVFIYTFIFGYA